MQFNRVWAHRTHTRSPVNAHQRTFCRRFTQTGSHRPGGARKRNSKQERDYIWWIWASWRTEWHSFLWEGWLVCDAQEDLWESRSMSQQANFHLWLHAPSNLVQGPSSLPNAYLSALLCRTLSQRLHRRRDDGDYEVLTEVSRSVVVWQVEWEWDTRRPTTTISYSVFMVPARRLSACNGSQCISVDIVTVHWQKNLDGESGVQNEQVFDVSGDIISRTVGLKANETFERPGGNYCDARHWRNIHTLIESTPPLLIFSSSIEPSCWVQFLLR